MKAHKKIALAVVCGTVASAAVADFVPSTQPFGANDFESDSLIDVKLSPTIESLNTTWGTMSSVRVVTFGIAFTTDSHVRTAHLYEITAGQHQSGFATTPGPMNAVDIVLLANLHPRLQDMKIGLSAEGHPVSTQLNGRSIERSFNTVLEELNYAPIGTGFQGGGGDISMSMSMSSAAGFTSDLPDGLIGVSGTSDTSNTPLGKHGNYDNDQINEWNTTGLYSGADGIGDSDNDLMVVPLPLPAVLAGIGLVGAVVMRHSLRRRSR